MKNSSEPSNSPGDQQLKLALADLDEIARASAKEALRTSPTDFGRLTAFLRHMPILTTEDVNLMAERRPRSLPRRAGKDLVISYVGEFQGALERAALFRLDAPQSVSLLFSIETSIVKVEVFCSRAQLRNWIDYLTQRKSTPQRVTLPRF